MSGLKNTGESNKPLPAAIFGVAIEGQTYKNVLYLLLAFPLGLVYWILLSVGLAVGIALSILAVGIGILLLTLIGIRVLARFEWWLANELLALDLPAPDDRLQADGFWSTIKHYLDAPSTWRGFGFLSLKLWVGIMGLVLVVFLWSMVELVSAPLRYPYEVEFAIVGDQPLVWSISSLPEAMLAVPVGALLGVAILHLSNGVAYIAKQMAAALLGNPAEKSKHESP